jgi:large subunit ribosomal protein L5
MAAITLDSKTYYDSAIANVLKDHQGKVNPFASASISKISINVGVGKLDPKQKADVAEYLQKLTGQKPKQVQSKVSIASFKLRKGDIVGLTTTLRGKKMQDFLLNLIYVALPRSRDFKGIKSESFDREKNSYSLGIDTATIFPLVGFDPSVNFGLQINLVFKRGTELNKELLTKLDFPFNKK